MDSDKGKIFVGGISWETTDEKLKEYFESYGEVVEAVIMKDRATGRGRGFGFVVFADPDVAERVVQETHTINGKSVEAKKAVPRDEHQNANKAGGTGTGTAASNTTRTKKIFVGGLAPNVTEEEFRAYFEQFGNITDVVVMYDHATQRPRGFGFITFDSEDSVDAVLQKTFHELKEKMVEVKRAVPKDASSSSSRSPSAAVFPGPRGPFGAYGQGFAPYAYSPVARGAYPYGYGAAAYGYGAYGGYGAGAYGATPAAYGAGAGAYGAGTGAYGPGGGARASGAWPSYGANSYGAGNGAGYGGGGTNWGGAPGGQQGGSTPGGGGYGYGYGGNEGGYPPNTTGYGGRTGGYTNTGYGGPNAAYGGYGPDGYGYSENTWRGDSYGGAPPAGGGYGGTSPAADSGTGSNGGSGGGYGGYNRQSQRGDLFYE